MNREEIEKLAARLETCDVRFQFKRIEKGKVIEVLEIPWEEAIPLILSKFPLWSLIDMFEEEKDEKPTIYLFRDK